MGWASGSEIGEELFKKLRKHIKPESEKVVAKIIYNMMCDNDADAWYNDMEIMKAKRGKKL